MKVDLSKLTTVQRKRLDQGLCIDCGGRLYGGPSGGMSQNVMCSKCGEEFNMMGAFGLDRMGKNSVRARTFYGFDPIPVPVGLWLKHANDPRPKKKPFWRRMFA